METRAKDLKDLTMWNSTNSSIKFFDLGNTVLSEGLFFDGNLAIAPAQIHREGFSEFDDKFTVPFLYNKIRQDLPDTSREVYVP
jgi:hypothetical protein